MLETAYLEHLDKRNTQIDIHHVGKSHAHAKADPDWNEDARVHASIDFSWQSDHFRCSSNDLCANGDDDHMPCSESYGKWILRKDPLVLEDYRRADYVPYPTCSVS